MVPLDERHTVLDWIAALSVPALLVAGSYLGTLSHTLTAVRVLEDRGCRVAGIVVNESAEQPVTAAETAACLRRFAGAIPVAVVRRHESASAAARSDAQELGRLADGFL
jgi:dethiobiotin synthetase